jgi:hypothetical protein
MTAEALKQSAKSLEEIGVFNQSVADINSKRRLEALRKAAVRGGTIYDVERVCLEMERRQEETPCE